MHKENVHIKGEENVLRGGWVGGWVGNVSVMRNYKLTQGGEMECSCCYKQTMCGVIRLMVNEKVMKYALVIFR